MEQLIPQAGTQNISCKLIDYEPGLHDGCLFSATLVAEGDEKPFPQTFKEESFIQYTFLQERLYMNNAGNFLRGDATFKHYGV